MYCVLGGILLLLGSFVNVDSQKYDPNYFLSLSILFHYTVSFQIRVWGFESTESLPNHLQEKRRQIRIKFERKKNLNYSSHVTGV